jgi:hypothetical protein
MDRSRERSAQGQTHSSAREASGPGRMRPGLRVSWSEPRQEAAFEFLGDGAEGAAVVGAADLPELCVGGACVNALRVTHGNVAIDLAVNQENRDLRGCGRILW